MDIISKAAEALQPISKRGIRVEQGWYDAKYNDLHITLWLLSDAEDSHSDDDADVLKAQIQINIWSKHDQVSLKNEIRKLLKQNGFAYLGGNDDLDTEAKVFMNAMRFEYAEETEENFNE